MSAQFLLHPILFFGYLLLLGAIAAGLILLVARFLRAMSPEQKLKRLAGMCEEGVISKSEFEQAKGKLLSRV
jgi:hypothetical protein